MVIPTGTIVKFNGQEVPTGWIRASGTLVKNTEQPSLYRSIKGNTLESGDRFEVPSGDDRYLLGREIPTNKTWLSGQRIYRYGIDAGTMPNTTFSDVSFSGITYQYITAVYGVCTNGTIYFPMPGVYRSSAPVLNFQLYIPSANNVRIRCDWDASGYTGYVFVEYVKADNRDSPGSWIIKV